jgi:hypothetical protein
VSAANGLNPKYVNSSCIQPEISRVLRWVSDLSELSLIEYLEIWKVSKNARVVVDTFRNIKTCNVDGILRNITNLVQL